MLAAIHLAVAVSLAAIGGARTNTICLAPASAQMVTNNNTEAMNAVRDLFATFLTGPSISATALNSRLPSQARQEAKQNGCAFVLFTTLKHTRKEAGGGLLGKMVTGAAQQGAMSVGAATNSNVGRVAANTIAGAAAAAASSLATSTKAYDQLELSYRLEGAAGQVILEKSAKRKAKADGEDLLTPLVERAADEIATTTTK